MKAFLLVLFLFITPEVWSRPTYCSNESLPLDEIDEMLSKKAYSELESYLKKNKKKFANLKNINCETLYHTAIRARHEELRKILDKTGYGPKNAKAVNAGHDDMSDLGLYRNSYFAWALQYGLPETYDDLKKRGGSTSNGRSYDPGEMAHVIGACNNSGLITHLVKKGVDINKTKDSHNDIPIIVAATKCKKRVLEEVVRNGGDVNYYKTYSSTWETSDESPLLRLYARYRKGEIGLDYFDVLINGGLDLDKIYSFDTIMIKAVYDFDEVFIQYLLDHGADINKETKYDTALIAAIDMLKVPYHREDYEKPEYIESPKKVMKMMKFLLERGADPNIYAANPRGPIHRAVYLPAEGLFLLLKYGADPRARDNEGNTILHRASLYHSSETLLKLAEAIGPGFDLRNNKGRYPSQYYYVEEYKHKHSQEVIDTLKLIEKKYR